MTLKIKNAVLGVFLLDNDAMRELDKRYAGKNQKFVEVLSFGPPVGFPRPESKKRCLGEIYINSGVRSRFRLKRLLIHGILHLLGFDHERKNDIIKMEAMEKRIVRDLNSKL